jgi:predicted XRE-type DNA-binding protein
MSSVPADYQQSQAAFSAQRPGPPAPVSEMVPNNRNSLTGTAVTTAAAPTRGNSTVSVPPLPSTDVSPGSPSPERTKPKVTFDQLKDKYKNLKREKRDLEYKTEQLTGQAHRNAATIDQLREQYTESEKLREERDTDYERLQQRLEQLQIRLDSREQEYDRLQANFISHMRAIRATDDDLSTIRTKLANLHGSVSQFSMGLKKHIGDRNKAAKTFARLYPHLESWLNKEPLEAPVIMQLTEKLVNETLIRAYLAPGVYPGVRINGAYKELSHWMHERGGDDAVLRLKQQLCYFIARDKTQETRSEMAAAHKSISDQLFASLLEIYPSMESIMRSKIDKFIEKAFDLSLAMRGQEVEVKVLPVKEGDSFDTRTMAPDFRGTAEGQIKLVVCPPFEAVEGDHGFLLPAKILCY